MNWRVNGIVEKLDAHYWNSRNFTGSMSTKDTQKITSAPGEFCASATIAITMENSLTYQLRGENP